MIITDPQFDPIYGAIFGDIVGSVYEFHNIKTKEFPMFVRWSTFTDDTVLTLAVGAAIRAVIDDGPGLVNFDTTSDDSWKEYFTGHLLAFAKEFPHAGYGGRFKRWMYSEDPQPYNSCGNGSAMRVSPVACFARSLEECEHLAKLSAEVTHNHPDGVAGAQATAGAIFLAQHGAAKDEIKAYVDRYYADEVARYTEENKLASFTLDEIRPVYCFDKYAALNRGTVPFALQAFLESDSFEDCIRNTVSIGGDTDTLGAISGAIAAGFYGFNWKLYGAGIEEKLTRNLARTLGSFPAHFGSY